ncbi:DoxX family protein [Ancylobacter amanitiformis]|uniref:Oxidoreductase n=1 Tax=Ancylobacter amanitiformis TaxID=217069 RepID=A0ABU0LRF8_9HYPH|nr:DoxX family protein [Ancylobacter amanitiformis]MDQ0511248.1 putative oxidoreductase [Ancylobacter amanitiformis]
MNAVLNRLAPHVLSLLRVASALLVMQHGTTKILGFPATQMSGVSIFTMAGAAGVIELVGGLLLLIGLFSRATAFILSGMTAVAYFLVHAPRDFFPINNGGELAALYCFVFFYLVFAGPGPWSVDALRGGEKA